MGRNLNNKGFTLVELLATIVILAMIGVISFVSINGVIEQNKIKNCENLENSIKSAAKEYVSDKRYNNSFVSSVQDMKVLLGGRHLINNKNLSGDVYNPFDNEDNITNISDNSKKDKLFIQVFLKENYTAKDVDIYYDKNDDGSISDDEKFICNEDFWK